MSRYLNWALALVLLAGPPLASGLKSTDGGTATASVDELLNLLPDSHVVGVIDMPRAVRELLPRLKTIDALGISKLASEFEEFANLAGLDATKASFAVLGVKIDGLKVRGGALVVEGIDLDAKALERATVTKQWKFQTIIDNGSSDGRGKPIFGVARVPQTPAQGKQDELFLAQIGAKRVVAGDLESVKSVVINAGAASAKTTSESSLTLRNAIKQSAASGLVRFALVIPEDLRTLLAAQGDLFAQLAAVKVVSGTLDMKSDQSLALNALLTTNSKEEATQMEAGLKGLVLLGKSFLGGDSDERMKGIAQLLDQVQIATQASDVSLSLIVTKALLDQLTKSTGPK